MKARRIDAVWRALDAPERARLALVAARDGLDPDPAVERLMPRHQWDEYAGLMRFGLTVLTRLRPAAIRLEVAVDALEAQVELLVVRQAWAVDRAALLSYVRVPRGKERDVGLLREQLEAAGPLVSDLSVLRNSRFDELQELEVAPEDVRAKLTVVSALARLRRAWPSLLALEQAVPVVEQYFADREFAESLLAAHLKACRVRLLAAHRELEALLGPVELPERQTEAEDAVRELVRSALPVVP